MQVARYNSAQPGRQTDVSRVHPRGFEPLTFGSVDRESPAPNDLPPKKLGLHSCPICTLACTEGNAIKEIAELWPRVPDAVRQQVLALMRAIAGPETSEQAAAPLPVPTMHSNGHAALH